VSTHTFHPENKSFYFITFTCYKWLSLFEEVEIYDYLHFWFEKLNEQGCFLNGYVIMPNHMHLVVYLNAKEKSLNEVVAESKRFLAYEIVKRLKNKNKAGILDQLKAGVQQNEKAKGKKHQVFRLSFDAKPLQEKDVEQVLDYIHRNPVSGVWSLVDDFAKYSYSSAGYYELNEKPFYKLIDFREVISISESSSSDSE